MEGLPGREQQVGGIQRFYKKYGSGQKRNELEEINNKFLLGTDKDGKTAWQSAVDWRNSEILQEVWEWAKEKATRREKQKFLFGTEKDGMTAWHRAAQRINSEILEKLWVCAKEKLTTEEINNKILLCTDKEGMTA